MSDRFAAVLETVGELYECAVTARLPQDALGKLAGQLGARHFAVRLMTPQASLQGWHDWPHSQAYTNWIGTNPCLYSRRLATLRPDRVYAHEQVLPFRELERTDYYVDFVGPHRIEMPEGIAFVPLTGEDLPSVRISFLGLQARGLDDPWGRFDHRLLARILPHLRRAFRLFNLCADQDFLRAAEALPDIAAIIDRLAYGVAITDATGRLRLHNRLAGELIAAGDGMTVAGGRLQAADGSSALADLVEEVARGRRAGGTLRLRRAGSARPLDVMVYGLKPGLFQSHRGALVAIVDPDRPTDATAASLMQLAALTPAEVALALDLHRGLTPAEHASRQGISRNTVKWHLANLLEKIGGRRQADAVRWVSERALLAAPAAGRGPRGAADLPDLPPRR